MKVLKLKKSEYTNLESLLRRAGLVNENDLTASPELLYVNEATYKQIQRSLIKEFKKQNPFLAETKIEYSVNAYLLNLGPNVVKNKDGGSSIPRGIAIVKN